MSDLLTIVWTKDTRHGEGDCFSKIFSWLCYLNCLSSCSTNSHSLAFSEAALMPGESGAITDPAVWKASSAVSEWLVSHSCEGVLISGAAASGRLLTVLSAEALSEAIIAEVSVAKSPEVDVEAVSFLASAPLTEFC